MAKRIRTFPNQNIKWATKKPLTPGRFWWSNADEEAPSLVYVEKQSLGFYVLGVGWLAYQPGQWAGPFGAQDPAANN